ncbi:MAG: peptidoglycan-binding protein [Candidatus Paceibacterota bacterium]
MSSGSGSSSSGSKASSKVVVQNETPVQQEVATTEPEAVVEDNIVNTEPMPNPTPDNALTKDLWYGIKDLEVKILQKSLNKLGFSLAETGPGSLGSETNFFGPLTRSALIKFQEKYSEKVLAPYNLDKGTGYFGEYSRSTMNSLLGM